MHSSLSASLRKAVRKVTEVNILDEDYRQPVSRNEKVQMRNLIAADLRVGFCCLGLAIGNRIHQFLRCQMCRNCTPRQSKAELQLRRTMPKRFCPSPSKFKKNKHQEHSRGIIRQKERREAKTHTKVSRQKAVWKPTVFILSLNCLLSEMSHLMNFGFMESGRVVSFQNGDWNVSNSDRSATKPLKSNAARAHKYLSPVKLDSS
jgi:hypothetical protein